MTTEGRRPGFVGCLVKLWRRHDQGLPDGCPFETVILDYIDGTIHIRSEAGRDYWIPVLVLGTIEVLEEAEAA